MSVPNSSSPTLLAPDTPSTRCVFVLAVHHGWHRGAREHGVERRIKLGVVEYTLCVVIAALGFVMMVLGFAANVASAVEKSGKFGRPFECHCRSEQCCVPGTTGGNATHPTFHATTEMSCA